MFLSVRTLSIAFYILVEHITWILLKFNSNLRLGFAFLLPFQTFIFTILYWICHCILELFPSLFSLNLKVLYFHRILWNVLHSHLSYFEYNKNIFIKLDMILPKL
jgi:hypothetical protein